jgi:hypothetical protein
LVTHVFADGAIANSVLKVMRKACHDSRPSVGASSAGMRTLGGGLGFALAALNVTISFDLC